MPGTRRTPSPRRTSFNVGIRGHSKGRETAQHMPVPTDEESRSRRNLLADIEEKKPHARWDAKQQKITGVWFDEWFCGLAGCVRRMIGRGKGQTRRASKSKNRTRRSR